MKQLIIIIFIICIPSILFAGGLNKTPKEDKISESTIFIDTIHQHIHKGDAYICSSRVSLGSGAVLNALLVVPSGYTVHLRHVTSTTGGPILIDMYEETTVSANGSAGNWRNANRNFPDTPNMEIYSGPTITSDGTLIFQQMVPGTGGFFGGGATLEIGIIEIVLKPNTNYLLRFTNNSTGTETVNNTCFWYEYVIP